MEENKHYLKIFDNEDDYIKQVDDIMGNPHVAMIKNKKNGENIIFYDSTKYNREYFSIEPLDNEITISFEGENDVIIGYSIEEDGSWLSMYSNEKITFKSPNKKIRFRINNTRINDSFESKISDTKQYEYVEEIEFNNETYTSSDKNKYYFSEDNGEKQLILEICNDYDGSYKCYQYYNININNNNEQEYIGLTYGINGLFNENSIDYKGNVGLINDWFGIGRFNINGNFNISGNISSLLYGEKFNKEANLNIEEYAFCNLFRGCEGLISAKELSLPYVNLSKYCYYGMFQGCKNLTEAPELPAETLASNCYAYMFSGCTNLETTPALTATTLSGSCYYGMFSGCTGLTVAPALPATTLATYCYYGMFAGCTRLKTAPVPELSSEELKPKLPATSLSTHCYAYMFSGCESLETAPLLPATTLRSSCYEGMFSGCTSLTTAPALNATRLQNYCYSYMFSGCTRLKTAPVPELSSEEPKLPATSLSTHCYAYMFSGCESLETAPLLPATTLRLSCYKGMFKGCIGLTSTPELTATTLAVSCYEYMFSGCTGLTTPPTRLSSPTLASNCYAYMFSGSGLTEAPSLPATSLSTSCYEGMFKGCTGLTTAPVLPADTLITRCYAYMFSGSGLTEAPSLPALKLESYCYNGMFSGCTGLTEAPVLPAETLRPSCYLQMFEGCSNLKNIKMLATYIGAKDCLSNWVSGVSSEGEFYKNVIMISLEKDSSNGIPKGWKIYEDNCKSPSIVNLTESKYFGFTFSHNNEDRDYTPPTTNEDILGSITGDIELNENHILSFKPNANIKVNLIFQKKNEKNESYGEGKCLIEGDYWFIGESLETFLTNRKEYIGENRDIKDLIIIITDIFVNEDPNDPYQVIQ